MTWLDEKNVAGWPVHMLYSLEWLFIGLAVLFVVLTACVRKTPSLAGFVGFLAAVFAGVATMWPVAFWTFFFGGRGEAMMATLPLAFLGTPLAILFWFFVFAKCRI
jgi:hypothetical protein